MAAEPDGARKALLKAGMVISLKAGVAGRREGGRT